MKNGRVLIEDLFNTAYRRRTGIVKNTYVQDSVQYLYLYLIELINGKTL